MRTRNGCDFRYDPLQDAKDARRIEEDFITLFENGPDVIDRVHNETVLEKLIDQATALAEDLQGETRMRCLMSIRCLLDTQDALTEEGIKD